ncbi:MAG: hypothetical protein ACJAZO_002619 [Myxococcota bacterium]|jgi:hypothetical protein
MRQLSALIFLTSSACWAGLSANGEVREAPDDTGLEIDTAGDADADSDADVDTEPELDTEPEPEADTEPQPEPEPDTEPPPPEPVACYPGVDGVELLCLDLVEPAVLPSDYAYPVRFQGSPQFREPRAFIDVDTADLDVSLAPNFQLFEFVSTGGALMVVQPESVVRLQAIRNALGPIIIELGYRSPAENTADNGGLYDRYIYGDGFRIRAVNATSPQVANACRANGAGFVQELGLMVHCDWRNVPVHLGFYDYP